MTTQTGIQPLRVAIFIAGLIIPTTLNILILNYVSGNSLERNDTTLFEALLLMLCFLATISFSQDAIRKLYHQRTLRNMAYTATALFNLYYFFKMMICCISIPGTL